MKTRILLLALLVALVAAGCGLTSGTVFVKQDVSGQIQAQATQTLDDGAFKGVVVDLTENSDWKKVTIEGVEDVCIRLTADNLLDQPVSGEVWITAGLDTAGIYSRADVISHGGFRIFRGLALSPGERHHLITCSETLRLLENLDRLSDVVKNGKFAAWGVGDQTVYHITFDGIAFGMHVTGSLQ
jgi:hypothetical protein